MKKRVRVILVTDGDSVAQEAVETVAQSLNLRCISASAGNPTPISGETMVNLIKQAEHDPVLVMFDDKGEPEKGMGEFALEYVAKHPDIEVLGAVAVASNTTGIQGAKVDLCIVKDGTISRTAVDKKGDKKCGNLMIGEPIIKGDTVDILNELDIPLVVGIGDVGKMKRKDDICIGAPITRKAIEEILQKNSIDYQTEIL
ncbi:stage V sporulation protein AE [Anaerosinus sp.]|uniref:stage V sporulation protein AE n=1 Tax=Selenobaculum sp. TaxID=3074374 RepID=UPI0015A9B2BA